MLFTLFLLIVLACGQTGKCGQACLWEFDSTTKNLAIKGSGVMTMYLSGYNPPWYGYRSEILTVNIEGITSIGSFAFSGCESLKTISIPKSVTSIGNNAFSSCFSLETISIPESVTSIGSYTFSYCTSLETISIPNSVTSIGSSTFSGCSSLKTISIPESVTSIGSYTFSYCTSLETISIPNSVTSIGSYIFSYCTSLKSVILPNSVKTIGSSAFYKCTSLKSIALSNTLTTIDSEAFYGCSSLKSITIPESVTTIKSGAFNSCYSLFTIEIPINNKLSIFFSDTFYFHGFITLSLTGNGLINDYNKSDVETSPWFKLLYCFKTIVIQEGVTSIGNYSFCNLTNLETLFIPSSLTSIGSNAFDGTSSLKNLVYVGVNEPVCETNYSNSLFKIAVQKSYNSSFFCSKNVITGFEGSCGDACEWKFYSSIYHMRINGSGIMNNYNSQQPWIVFKAVLKNVTIESISSIGSYAFSGFISLESIIIPNSVTLIESNAFSGCKSLESIIIPNSVTFIKNYAFSECSSMGSVILSNSLTSIGDRAFFGCKLLESIIFPNSLKSIGNNAFSSCSLFKTISIPNSVTSIGNSAFSSCSLLETISIPNSITSIGSYTFSGCTSLKSISIPESVTSIGSGAFFQCTSLQSIETLNSDTSILDSAFSGCTSLKSIRDGIHYFGKFSFQNTAIESVVIGNDKSVYIDEGAFAICKNLKSVVIKPRFKSNPNNTSTKSCSIKKNAFLNCPNIESFVIDGYVDEVKEYAFSFNEINKANFQYKSLSSPQICSSLDKNNETMLLPIFSESEYLINVPKNYQSNVFCPCDKSGCPISYIENKDYNKIQNASVSIAKTLNDILDGSNEDEGSGNNPNEGSENGALPTTFVFVISFILMII